MFKRFEDGCTVGVIMPDATEDGSVIVFKNTDASNPNSAKYWHFNEGGKHPSGSIVQTSYAKLKQVPVTYRHLIEGYYDRWGGSFGVNENNVVVTTDGAPIKVKRDEVPRDPSKAIGVSDMGRLILERAKTAKEGMEILADFYESGYSVYMTCFEITDEKESWLVETIPPHHFVAKRITSGFYVSPPLQITDKWDVGSPDIIDYAIEKGWFKPGAEFNFAKAYGEWPSPYAQPRHDRAMALLAKKGGEITVRDIMSVTRDHYEGDIRHYVYPPHTLSFFDAPNRPLCLDRSTNSMIVKIRKNKKIPKEMRAQIWFCMASPCCSVYTPYYMGVRDVPQPYKKGESYQPKATAWWVFESLRRKVDENYRLFHPYVRGVWSGMKEMAFSAAPKVEKLAVDAYSRGDKKGARNILTSYSNIMCEAAIEQASSLSGCLDKMTQLKTEVSSPSRKNFRAVQLQDRI